LRLQVPDRVRLAFWVLATAAALVVPWLVPAAPVQGQWQARPPLGDAPPRSHPPTTSSESRNDVGAHACTSVTKPT